MRPEDEICKGLESAGIDFVCTLPCVMLEKLIELVEKKFPSFKITREEEGVGICAGAYLGGRRPTMIIQNSGIGNSVNALKSLNETFSVPLLLLVSQRGDPGEKIVAQIPMGKVMRSLLRTLEIRYFEPSTSNLRQEVEKAAKFAFEKERVVVILLREKVMK